MLLYNIHEREGEVAHNNKVMNVVNKLAAIEILFFAGGIVHTMYILLHIFWFIRLSIL